MDWRNRHDRADWSSVDSLGPYWVYWAVWSSFVGHRPDGADCINRSDGKPRADWEYGLNGCLGPFWCHGAYGVHWSDGNRPNRVHWSDWGNGSDGSVLHGAHRSAGRYGESRVERGEWCHGVYGAYGAYGPSRIRHQHWSHGSIGHNWPDWSDWSDWQRWTKYKHWRDGPYWRARCNWKHWSDG